MADNVNGLDIFKVIWRAVNLGAGVFGLGIILTDSAGAPITSINPLPVTIENLGSGQATEATLASLLAAIKPAQGAFVITPNNSNDQPHVTRTLYVGTGGDLAVVMANADTCTIPTVPSGTFLPIAVKRVLTSSSASGLVGLY